MNLMIELTNRCTLRCPTCFSHQDGRVKKDMGMSDFRRIIDESNGLIDSISLYNYGEPLLNGKLLEMILYAKMKGVRFIKVATNAMQLTPAKAKKIILAGLDYISISMDGATPDTYKQFRKGGRFETVVAHTRELVKLRNTLRGRLKIEIQFIIMRHNEHEIEAIEKLAQELGVDRLRLKTVLIKKDLWRHLLPRNERFSRYAPQTKSTRCFKPTKELVVNGDGTVIPCCYIVEKDVEKFKMGNIFEQSLEEILNSEKYKSFVEKCTTDKSQLSSCKDCEEGNLSLDYGVIDVANGRKVAR